MRHYVGYSEKKKAQEAVEDSSRDLSTQSPSLILFASDIERFQEFTDLFHQRFPSSEVLGATTYVSLTKQGVGRTAVSFLALFGEMECQTGVILDIKRYPEKYRSEVERCRKKIKMQRNMFCFEVMTAFSNSEELVLDTFHSVLGNDVPLLGSSAGNDGENGSKVSKNGCVYPEGCVFAVLSSKMKVHLFRENIYKPMQERFTATDVDCERRIVYEFDQLPAAQVIRAALKISEDELPSALAIHPLGRLYGSQINLVEGRRLLDEGALSFYARIYNNTKLALMELDDPSKVGLETKEQIYGKVKNPAFAIVISCLERSRMYEQKGILQKSFCNGEFAEDYFLISGYGEQMNGKHLNATLVAAVFEQEEQNGTI